MDYKIAKFFFNQTTKIESEETLDWMGNNLSDEEIYIKYKEVINFVERNCRGLSGDRVDVAWSLYVKQFFPRHIQDV